jgi:predicted dehydrogenase
MRQILLEEQAEIATFIARYNCAYEEIHHPFWWDKKKSGGPIVEQATHFIDLARYLCGEVRPESVRGVSLPAHDESGLANLKKIPLLVKEHHLPDEERTPRVTSAVWRFYNGAVGNLTHAVLMHGKEYHAEIEIWADGVKMVLEDPYTDRCRLRVRRGRAPEEIYEFGHDDVYYQEDLAFIQAIREDRRDLVRSPYDDAMKTYALSWLIRSMTEEI